ncbi:hypothetical protein GCM10028794_07750 [Silanimonas algicola]
MPAPFPSKGKALRAVLFPLLALGTLGARTADASAGVVYRCTATDGAIALQDEPCPPGQKQERRVISAFAPPPPSTPAAAPTPAGTDDDTPASPRIIVGEVGPSRRVAQPPPLWRCTDLNGRSRLVDDDDPQPRCVPLSVLGVDLSRAPPSAATLCRTVEDACVELSGEAACAAWEERLDAAESALRHAFSDTQAERRRERDRAKAVVDDDCRG